MSSGLNAFGTVLVWNYAKLAELRDISGPSQTADTVELTSHDSANGFKEYVSSVRDGGEITIDANLIPGDTPGQIAFNNDLISGTVRTFKIVLPMSVGNSWEGNAIASGFNPAFPYNDRMSVAGTLKITGKPVLLTTQSAGMSGLTGIEQHSGTALTIAPTIAVGTYQYTCAVDTSSTWVKLTITAAGHSIYANGAAQTSGAQGGEIALGASGTNTLINIVVFENAKAPRIYTLTVTRP